MPSNRGVVMVVPMVLLIFLVLEEPNLAHVMVRWFNSYRIYLCSFGIYTHSIGCKMVSRHFKTYLNRFRLILFPIITLDSCSSGKGSIDFQLF
jgi:hypothetical protein